MFRDEDIMGVIKDRIASQRYPLEGSDMVGCLAMALSSPHGAWKQPANGVMMIFLQVLPQVDLLVPKQCDDACYPSYMI